METILKYIEASSKYGFPIPLMLLLVAVGFWATSANSWSEREKYYYELLGALGKWKNSITDRQTYYMQPGSEYSDDTITAQTGFKSLSTKGSEALGIVRDQLPVARLFLSPNTIALLDDMLSDHWLIAEMDAVCMSDYLDKTLPLVKRAYDSVLADAKKDLKKSRYLALINKFLPK